ncbi:hypothetical protein FA95DRAFT_1567188 [Auriscalpium vulgare]|uniref:Uncharacterized protein n=1 Tax=Auriscalpium vulgare TaxID=40419 RepID=A0ACB8R5N7_9AGAM|nr:hypothetical protein FA95DRAFT_1567188 [Auriscalpium vulgare]
MSTGARFKLVFFCPAVATQSVLEHLFATDPQHLGKIGNYSHCAFLSRGTGQFRPEDGAQPAIGTPGTLEYVDEDRVEILVTTTDGNHHELQKALKILKAAHPYEEVAYDVYRLEDF